MITEQDIEVAQERAAQTQAALEAIEQSPPEADAGQAWSTAKGRQTHAEATLRRLVQQREAQLAELAEREKVEKASAKQITALGKGLEERRDRLTAAIVAAQAALVAVVDAAREHDGAVTAAAAELTGMGLPLQNGDEHQTGGTAQGYARINGAGWMTVNPADLVSWVAERVRLTRTEAGGRYGVGVLMRRLEATSRVTWSKSLGLDAIALPEEIHRKPRAVVSRAPIVPASMRDSPAIGIGRRS